MSIPSNITKECILEAIQEIDHSPIEKRRRSRGYCLVNQSKHYPPKYVISIANIFANGQELESGSFNGGDCPTCANVFLRRRGFEVVECKCRNTQGWALRKRSLGIKRSVEREGMTKERFRALALGEVNEPINEVSDKELADRIGQVLRSDGWCVSLRKVIPIELNKHCLAMRYIPDITIRRTESSNPEVIIEVEGKDKTRKMLTAEIVLAGLAGARLLITVARDPVTAKYVERYGCVLAGKIAEIKNLKVVSICAPNTEELENKLRQLIGNAGAA